MDRDPPVPWSDGGKIPWSDPAFSARMLREHLLQVHDRASRRFETVDRHVQWIHQSLLGAGPGRVLDRGCGPGLYTSRLASRGHRCVGIDYSPASIEYARSQAEGEGLDCEYRLQDLLAGGYRDSEYETLLRAAGFEHIERVGSLEGTAGAQDDGLFVLVCRAA